MVFIPVLCIQLGVHDIVLKSELDLPLNKVFLSQYWKPFDLKPCVQAINGK